MFANREDLDVGPKKTEKAVAGIYNVGIIPEARGQGIGTAMTIFLLREAKAAGYRIAILQASDMGVNLYHRIGFATYFKLSMYAWTGHTV